MPDYSLQNFIDTYLENDEFPPITLTTDTNFLGNGFLNRGTNTIAKSLKEILVERLNLSLVNDRTVDVVTARNTVNTMSKDNLYNNTWINNTNTSIFYWENETLFDSVFNNSFHFDVSLEYIALMTRWILPFSSCLYARNVATKSGTWTNNAPTPNSVWSIGTVTLNDYLEHTFTDCRYIMVQFPLTNNTTSNWQFILDGTSTNNNIYRTTPNGMPSYNGNNNIVSCAIFDMRTTGTHTIRIVNKAPTSASVKSIDMIYAWRDSVSQNPMLVLSFPKFDSRYSNSIGANFDQYTPQRWRFYNTFLYNVCRTMRAIGLQVTFYDIKNKCMTYTAQLTNGLSTFVNTYPSTYWFEIVADEIITNALKTN